jgi:HEAT repeat protein
MPFVKHQGSGQDGRGASGDTVAVHVAGLTNPDANARWGAARMLGGVVGAVPALSRALEKETEGRVREAILTALIRTGDEASVRALLPSVRSQDASRRAAAIEALQVLPDAIAPFLTALLADGDSDVRLLATELTRNMPAERATDILCNLLEREMHPNVCAAAVEVLAEVGTEDAKPVLAACAERFRDSPFLLFAITTTMARISGAEGS